MIILAVIVLLFGASKLPELARGSGRALRIFKAETKGLNDDDTDKTPEQRQIDAQGPAITDTTPRPQANPEETRPPGTV